MTGQVEVHSDLLPYVLLITPLVGLVATVLLVFLAIRYRDGTNSLTERAAVSVLLSIASLGWAVLVGQGFFGYRMTSEFQTWVFAASVLLPTVTQLSFLGLFAYERFRR